MERNEADNIPAAQERNPSGDGRRTGSYKVVIVIWVTLLLGGTCWVAYSRQKNAAEAERLLNDAYTLYEQTKFAESTESLRKSAELGNAWAQLYYGERLKTGFYAEQDTAEAVKWLRKAAHRKNFEACYQLGVCYENGEGVEQNPDEAAVWYRKALADPAFAASAQEALDRIADAKTADAAGND